jgi:serine/threonine protein phosphatase PrpC
MGTYLSTPASEKYKEWGEDLECPVQPLRFAVIDMQGWRKSMEDAHIVEMTVPYPPGLPYLSDKKYIPKAKVFGVFDGHGGPEVARFCQLYLVSVLTKQKLWQDEPPAVDNEENTLLISPGESDNPAEVSAIGQALIESFHALDRMIDDPTRR